MLTRAICLSALASLAAAHGAITAVKGANGLMGVGMGIDPSTPRNGVTAKPYQVCTPTSPYYSPPLTVPILQQDTSIIRDFEIMTGKVGPCGRTKQKGAIDIAAEMEGEQSILVYFMPVSNDMCHPAASSAGLPSATSSGEIQMTLHQVNQDGAGYVIRPILCTYL
jgi:hypothetical protein